MKHVQFEAHGASNLFQELTILQVTLVEFEF